MNFQDVKDVSSLRAYLKDSINGAALSYHQTRPIIFEGYLWYPVERPENLRDYDKMVSRTSNFYAKNDVDVRIMGPINGIKDFHLVSECNERTASFHDFMGQMKEMTGFSKVWEKMKSEMNFPITELGTFGFSSPTKEYADTFFRGLARFGINVQIALSANQEDSFNCDVDILDVDSIKKLDALAGIFSDIRKGAYLGK